MLKVVSIDSSTLLFSQSQFTLFIDYQMKIGNTNIKKYSPSIFKIGTIKEKETYSLEETIKNKKNLKNKLWPVIIFI